MKPHHFPTERRRSRRPRTAGMLSLQLAVVILSVATLAPAQFEAIRTLTPEQGQEVRRPIEAVIFTSSTEELADHETALLELFQSPETTLEGKQYTCRMLRYCASDASVPVLATELLNPELSEFVRRVFQSLETPAASAVLIAALPEAGDAIKIGLIGTLGQIGEKSAINDIAPYLTNDVAELQFASITALGNIGGRKACKILASAEVKPEFSGERKRAQMKAIEGVNTFPAGIFSPNTEKKIFSAYLEDEDEGIRCAALIGLTKTNAKKTGPTVLAALDSTDRRFRNTAIGLLHLLPTEQLSSVRLGMKSENQILLIHELARRGATEAEGMLILAVDSDNEAVKVAAIKALETVGGTEAIPVLIAMAPENPTAFETLCGLNVPGTDAAIIQSLETAEKESIKIKLMECLSARQTETALPLFTELAKGDWNRLTAVATSGMANLVSAQDFALYGELMLSTDNTKKIQALEKSIAAAAQRQPDADACSMPLIAVYGKARGEAKYAIIRSLGSIGGDAAKGMLTAGLTSTDPKIEDAAIRGLANWPSMDAADQLLQLATGSDNSTYQVITLRGYIRLAYTETDPNKRVDMCKKATEAATRPAELKNIIGCVKVVKEPVVLEFLIEQLDNPEVFTEAAWAICEISTHWKLKEAALPVLERIAITNDETLANEAKKRIQQING